MMRWMWEAGYRVSAGVLHLLDTDAQTAEELGIAFAAEVPFAPIGARVREEMRRLLGAARLVVVAPFAVGPSNLANLEELLELPPPNPVLLFGEKNRTGARLHLGRAGDYRALLARGASGWPRAELLRRLGELLGPPVDPAAAGVRPPRARLDRVTSRGGGSAAQLPDEPRELVGEQEHRGGDAEARGLGARRPHGNRKDRAAPCTVGAGAPPRAPGPRAAPGPRRRAPGAARTPRRPGRRRPRGW